MKTLGTKSTTQGSKRVRGCTPDTPVSTPFNFKAMDKPNLIALLEELQDVFEQLYGDDKYAAMTGAQKSIIKHLITGASIDACERAVKKQIIESRNEIAAAGPSPSDLVNDSSNAGGGFLNTVQP